MGQVRDAAGDSAAGVLGLFGSQLKLLRERAGIGRAEFGEVAGYSASTIASYEQGRRIAPPEFARKADEALDAGGVLALAAEEVGRQRLPVFFQDFAEYERTALSISWYGNQVAPGLLQTEAYARALLGAHWPALDEKTIDRRVADRLERQALLTRKPPPALCFILCEAVLLTPVGGPRVLKGQLERLLQCATLPCLQLQVLPFSHGAHVGLNGPMVVLETEDRTELAYMEPQGASQIVANPDQVGILAQRYGILRSQALTPEESAHYIQRAMGEL